MHFSYLIFTVQVLLVRELVNFTRYWFIHAYIDKSVALLVRKKKKKNYFIQMILKACLVELLLSSEIESAIRVQILDETVCILLWFNVIGKGKNLFVLSAAMSL